jgi:hypothetical protein
LGPPTEPVPREMPPPALREARCGFGKGPAWLLRSTRMGRDPGTSLALPAAAALLRAWALCRVSDRHVTVTVKRRCGAAARGAEGAWGASEPRLDSDIKTASPSLSCTDKKRKP